MLDAVLCEGRSLSTAIPSPDISIDRSMIMELSYGTLRWLPKLEALARLLLKKPLRNKDRDIHYLILLGLYQLSYMRIPPYAVVDETVTVVKGLGKVWAAALINSVLRNFQRQRDNLESSVAQKFEFTYAHPDWLAHLIKQSWPLEWESILVANQQRPPMTLRVNLTQLSRDEYLSELESVGIEASAHGKVDSAIVLAKPVDVARLPGFFEGHVSVQDAAAQLAPLLLDLHPRFRVLDACAAPGGKTGHLFEIEPQLDVVALDIDQVRLQRVAENLQRLGQKARLICGDAADVASWWDGELFDRILLDAPCSATGVIRRHPDIKYLRKAEDISALVGLQQEILLEMWSLLKPGGRMVYATCSIFPQENNQQMDSFLSQTQEGLEINLDVFWGRSMSVGRQILNSDSQGHDHSMDGFYYACIEKKV